jgi:3-oxoacyl-[acyl-carrier-protein] synthase III
MKHLSLAKISGTGHFAPARIVNNFDLEKTVDTTDEWIRQRTGMVERHYTSNDEATSDMAVKAGEKALTAAGLRGKDIDMVLVATVTPDHYFPSTACIVQKRMGLRNVPAFDISAGCTGFIYASEVARQFIENGSYKHILVIGGECLTKITNWNDRGTCILFGDAAGAAIYSQSEPGDISRVIDGYIESDGTYGDLLIQQAGGSRHPASIETVQQNQHTIYMEGNKIFRLAVKSMEAAADIILKRNNMDVESIDWLIAHQANLRIIEALGERMKIKPQKVIVNIERYGNTSSATIPTALDEAVRAGKIRRGDVILMVAFGAGLTSGSLLMRY